MILLETGNPHLWLAVAPGEGYSLVELTFLGEKKEGYFEGKQHAEALVPCENCGAWVLKDQAERVDTEPNVYWCLVCVKKSGDSFDTYELAELLEA